MLHYVISHIALSSLLKKAVVILIILLSNFERFSAPQDEESIRIFFSYRDVLRELNFNYIAAVFAERTFRRVVLTGTFHYLAL